MKKLYIFLSCFIMCYALYASQHSYDASVMDEEMKNFLSPDHAYETENELFGINDLLPIAQEISSAVQDPSPIRRDLFSPVITELVEEVPDMPMFISDNQLNEKLIRRVKTRDVIEVEKILSGYYAPHQFSIDYQDEWGKTPLIWAIELLGTLCPDTDMEKIINLLLEADADMAIQDRSGNSFVNYFLDNPHVAQESKDKFIKQYG